jgi:DinB superfamily
VADGPVESREAEVARVRSYLASQSLRRTPAELVEMLREAHQQFLAALALVPEGSFRIRTREGEWSAADVLLHMRTMAACDASAIPTVIDRGEQPPDIQDTIVPAPPDVTRSGLLADLEALRGRLLDVVLHAKPEAHLDILWGHPEFGRMHWREWMLFARVHTLDHARQVQAIAAAVAPLEGGGAHAGGD